MWKFRIPESQRDGLSIILSLSEDKVKHLTSTLEKVPKGLGPMDLSDYLSEKSVFSPKESAEVVKVLSALYRLKSTEPLVTDEVVNGISEALKETEQEDLRPRDGDWDKFKKNFKVLLSYDNTIGITFKTLALSTEYEKFYIDSNIYTDIRPAFNPDIEKKFDAATIIHTLKLEYHTGDRHDQVHVALDSRDLVRLRKQLQRAEEKEKSIKKNFKETIDFITPQNE